MRDLDVPAPASSGLGGSPEPWPAASPWPHAGIQGLGLSATVTALPLPGPISSPPSPRTQTGSPACCPGGLLPTDPPDVQLPSPEPGDGLQGCPRGGAGGSGLACPFWSTPVPKLPAQREGLAKVREMACLALVTAHCLLPTWAILSAEALGDLFLGHQRAKWPGRLPGASACLGPGPACSTHAPTTPGHSEAWGCCERPAPCLPLTPSRTPRVHRPCFLGHRTWLTYIVI